MEVRFNQSTRKLEFVIEKKDMSEAAEIEKTTKTKGWQILMGKLDLAREQLITTGKDSVKTRARREASPFIFATLDGLDQVTNLAPRIIKMAEEFNKKEKEEQNDGQQFNGD